MCGIAGFFSSSADPALAEALPAMAARLAHRGPDGRGLRLDPGRRCGLAHRRLAIIDPAHGQQPMTGEDGRVWVSFNGCIYNHRELAAELTARGHVFRTRCDTEAIVHAYEEWGPACVERFNGIWAFALWDAKAQTLLLSRDRLGVKPLYYARLAGGLVFASEEKALLAAPGLAPRPDHRGLAQYLAFQFCLEDATLFAGIRRLPPGHNLLLAPGREPAPAAYWRPSLELDFSRDEAWFTARLAELLADAVRLQLIADVPLGAYLSGGLDSSSLVGLARRQLGAAPLDTFTGGFAEGREYDETGYAREVAERHQTRHHQWYFGPGETLAALPALIWQLDEPVAGPGALPQFLLAERAAREVKVVLGGQGGDEIFIGYTRYLLCYLEECLRGAIFETARGGNYVATLQTIIPSLPSLRGYLPMMSHFWAQELFADPARRYWRLVNRGLEAGELYAPEYAPGEDSYQEFLAIFDESPRASLINRILNFDRQTHLQALLHLEDRVSMAWGLESRVPLLDHRLVELMLAVPPAIKFKAGRLKHLFRGAVGDLVPPRVLARQDKMGFPVPLNQWARGGAWREFILDTFASRACRERGLFRPGVLAGFLDRQGPYARGLWGALCLELWFATFLDQPPARVEPAGEPAMAPETLPAAAPGRA